MEKQILSMMMEVIKEMDLPSALHWITGARQTKPEQSYQRAAASQFQKFTCNYAIPAMMAARNATLHIQNGQMVTVNGKAGTVILENHK